MKSLVVVLVVLVSAFVLAAPASATYYLAIDWQGSVQQITFSIMDGNSSKHANAYISPARSWHKWDNGAWELHQPVFCVDVFNYAYDTNNNPNSQNYDVDMHVSDDNGWVTPPGDNDSWRDPNGIKRVAALVCEFGGSWLSTDTYDKTIGLNPPPS